MMGSAAYLQHQDTGLIPDSAQWDKETYGLGTPGAMGQPKKKNQKKKKKLSTIYKLSYLFCKSKADSMQNYYKSSCCTPTQMDRKA